MRFSKYQGLGNDFLVVDLRAGDPEHVQDPATARALCDRRFGVGGDGVLAVLPAETVNAFATMKVINADGSIAEMCGNGIRCVAKHLKDTDSKIAGDEIVIDTGAGPLTCSLQMTGGEVATVTVDMGRPYLTRGEIPMTGPSEERFVSAEISGESFTAVSMGNPHAITFVDDTGAQLRALADRVGPTIETHNLFPNRTNVEFARVASANEIELVVWERGCGITLACGTGACATVVAACLNGHCKVGDEVTVNLLGGPLAITVAANYERVYMRGPAAKVFDAEIDVAEVQKSQLGRR